MATESRPYSDADWAYIADTLDRPRDEVAAKLGRSARSIKHARSKHYGGWSQSKFRWTPDEDQVLLAHPFFSSEQLARKLAGRSAVACERRRRELGAHPVPNGMDVLPTTVGSRPLLAKTCRACGLLLPSGWFAFDERQKAWESRCRSCKGSAASVYYRNDRARGSAAARGYFAKAQEITVPRAHRKGTEWTHSDLGVLADETKTTLVKALMLNRTYAGTAHKVYEGGYKSHVGLGDPERDAWSILNPNEPYVEEITARLAAASAPPVPAQVAREAQWGWADA